MKKFIFVIGFFMICLLALPVWAATKQAAVGGTLKIGIVDMQKILLESRNSRNAQSAFMKDIEKRQTAIAAKERDIRKLEEEFNRLDSGAMDARKRKSEQIKLEMRELQYLREDAEGEFKRKEMEITQKIIAEIIQIVKNYARSEYFTIIMDRRAALAFEESIDITDRILKLYDAQKKH